MEKKQLSLALIFSTFAEIFRGLLVKPKLSIKPEKIPQYLALVFFTGGASLILGLLSFSGLFVLIPALPLGLAAFTLSVAYEGEIYWQNLTGALNKLFKPDNHRLQLARDYLLACFPEENQLENCPEFFRDYKTQIELVAQFGHGGLDSKSQTEKDYDEKTLSDMEKWFAALVLAKDKELKTQQTDTTIPRSEYAQKVYDWIENGLVDLKNQLLAAKLFSVTAALFMSLGSTYLIVDAFVSIPVLMAIPFGVLPFLVVPMALIAGVAYGLLTYNALHDMIINKTLTHWREKIQAVFSKEITYKTVLFTVASVLLFTLSAALTVCTAGTWWTVAKQGRPLFAWMQNKAFVWLMGGSTPVVIGLSAGVFNIENTAESLRLIEEAINNDESVSSRSAKIWKSLQKAAHKIRKNENGWQIINPFRILIMLTVTPLRILLFFGHLASIALTADRMPGIPEILSALIAIVCEGFEDFHYFADFGHTHHGKPSFKKRLEERLAAEGGHSHALDFPTKCLHFIASPLYLLAAVWDSVASQQNAGSDKPVLEPINAWKKQRGISEKHKVLPTEASSYPSAEWRKEQVCLLIEKYEKKYHSEHDTANGVVGEERELIDHLKTAGSYKEMQEKMQIVFSSKNKDDSLDKQGDFSDKKDNPPSHKHSDATTFWAPSGKERLMERLEHVQAKPAA